MAEKIDVMKLGADGVAHVAANYILGGGDGFSAKKTGVFLIGDFIFLSMIKPSEQMDFLNRGKYPAAEILEKAVYTTALSYAISPSALMNKLIVNGAASVGGYAYDSFSKKTGAEEDE